MKDTKENHQQLGLVHTALKSQDLFPKSDVGALLSFASHEIGFVALPHHLRLPICAGCCM